jgi:hypothetical protein
MARLLSIPTSVRLKGKAPLSLTMILPEQGGLWLLRDCQRMMANRAGAKTTDQAGSHAIYVSQPNAVAAIIEGAARGAAK